jgi:hypothetical protein
MADAKDRAVYVYGVVRSDAPLELTAEGIEGAGRSRVLAAGRLGAIVAEVDGEPVPTTRRNLNGHAEVLAEAARATTVLPMRFGVVFPSERDVEEELLQSRRATLESLLERYDGRVEVTLRGSYEDQDAVLREAATAQPEIVRLRDEVRELPDDAAYYARIRLGEMVARAVESRRAAEERRILERLEPLASATAREQELPERVVVKAAFLVERSRLAEFDREVDALAGEMVGRIRFSYTGPLALHSFVDLAPREEAAWVS